jgi:hypothetical protein
MRNLKIYFSIFPFLTSLFLLSDFVTPPDKTSTVVVKSYKVGNSYYVNYQNGYTELSPYQYYLVQVGDSATISTGKYSDTVLRAVISTKSGEIKIARTYESIYMMLIVGSIGLVSALGCFDFDRLEARTKVGGLKGFLSVLFPIMTLVGTLMGAKLLMVQLGFIDQF